MLLSLLAEQGRLPFLVFRRRFGLDGRVRYVDIGGTGRRIVQGKRGTTGAVEHGPFGVGEPAEVRLSVTGKLGLRLRIVAAAIPRAPGTRVPPCETNVADGVGEVRLELPPWTLSSGGFRKGWASVRDSVCHRCHFCVHGRLAGGLGCGN